jgi:glycosyltransferase involved in cell wall biosynthesis
MKKLLWIGDAGCPSGFAQATHHILDTLRSEFDVVVLGMNYRGDPHPYPYPIYACAPGGDPFGVGRLIWMCDLVKPDVIVLQNDGWNIQPYVRKLHLQIKGKYAFPEYASIPIIAAIAVDGKNFVDEWLDGVSFAIFWTQFALDEAREGGYAGPAVVIPLGVDLDIYHPIDRAEVRARQLPEQIRDAFIVGNVNRNQPRKRWDLMVKYFAAWINSTGIRDAYLYLHTAPTGDTGCDVKRLATYYGVVDRLALVQPEVFYGATEQEMVDTYNCFDVNASTTQGEGFGLTTLESMACGVPQILPDWSALGDWALGAAWLVPCLTTHIGPPYVNVIGGIADETRFVQALDQMYGDTWTREHNRQAALERAQEPRFRWADIGQAWLRVLDGVLELQAVQDLPGSVRGGEREHPLPAGSDAPSGPSGPNGPTEAEWADLGRPEEATT